jgi:hypothetical protein
VWRLLAAAAVPVMVGLWALWRDVLLLEAAGLTRVGGPRQLAEWVLLSVATVGLAATFWSASRSLRVLGYTFYALLLSVAFGVAGVLGVMHAFGGPQGNLGAPAWGLVALSLAAAACVGSLLATAALIVADVSAAEELDR